MKVAIASLDNWDRYDIKLAAKTYAKRQGNADLGDIPWREHYLNFFNMLRRYIVRQGMSLDGALNRLDLDYMNMDDM